MISAIIIILLVIAFTGVVIKSLLADGRPSKQNTSTEHLVNVKKKQNHQKQTKRHQKQTKPVSNSNTTTGKNKADKANVNIGTGTVIAGALLAHQLSKHHKHDDINDIDDNRSDVWDDDFDDLYDDDFNDYNDYDDTQYYEDSDYDYQRAAYEEEQAAYDDFIASLDMADD